MVTSVVMIALAGLAAQGRDQIDGYQRRKIFEATKAVEMWAQQEAQRLYPAEITYQSNSRRRAFLEAEQANCQKDLTFAGFVEVCEEYKVSRKTLRAIIDNPAVARQFPYSKDIDVSKEVQFDRNLPVWRRKGTLFNPEKVRLSAKLAKRYGFVNPAVRTEAEKALVGGSIIDRLDQQAHPAARPAVRPKGSPDR
jgi:hypothetical protein